MLSFYGASKTGPTLSSLLSSTNLQNYYSIAPLIVDGWLFISTSGLIFENNAKPELSQAIITKFYPSNAVTIRRSQGVLLLDNMTISNYNGFDLRIIETIYDSENFNNNVYTADPTIRNSIGIPQSLPSYPSFVIDYGFKNSLINLAKPILQSSDDFLNYFFNIEIYNLKIINITQYNPGTKVPIFIEIQNEWDEMLISNFDIQNADFILAQTGLFKLATYAKLTISNGFVSNINANAYSMSTPDFYYVTLYGGVFVFESLVFISPNFAVNYTINNISFSNIYGVIGSVFNFISTLNSGDSNLISVIIEDISISKSFSYQGGVISLDSHSTYVSISHSNFTSNTGINKEADLSILTNNGCDIDSVIFSNFSSITNVKFGRTINVGNLLFFTTKVHFNNIKINWNDKEIGTSQFYENNDNLSILFSKTSALLIYYSNVEITNSTFNGWYSGKFGGILGLTQLSTVYIENSEFKNNAGLYGGAIYLEGQSFLKLNNSSIINNIADLGGAIFSTMQSTIYISNLQCINNTSFDSGGWVFINTHSQIHIINSEISGNKADLFSSALFWLDWSNVSISNSVFSNNFANFTTIKIDNSPSNFDSVIFLNNYSFKYTLGIYAVSSDASINNWTFKNTEFPKGNSIYAAADLSFIYGGFIQLEALEIINITNWFFFQGYAVSGGAINHMIKPTVNIINCTFSKCYSRMVGGAISSIAASNLNILNWVFDENISKDGNDIALKVATAFIKDSKFNIFPSGGSITVNEGDFKGESLTFINKYPEAFINDRIVNGGAIYFNNVLSIVLNLCNFTNFNFASLGGAITININTNFIYQYPIYNITNWVFLNNSASNGGAIFIYHGYTLISSSYFINNSWKSSTTTVVNGGAILFSSTGKYIQFINIDGGNSILDLNSDNFFITNRASYVGGAIYWDYIEPKNLMNNVRTNCEFNAWLFTFIKFYFK